MQSRHGFESIMCDSESDSPSLHPAAKLGLLSPVSPKRLLNNPQGGGCVGSETSTVNDPPHSLPS